MLANTHIYEAFFYISLSSLLLRLPTKASSTQSKKADLFAAEPAAATAPSATTGGSLFGAASDSSASPARKYVIFYVILSIMYMFCVRDWCD